MGRKYKIHDQQSVYFVTFTVVNWIDIFTRDDYRSVITDSIEYCQENKGLKLYAWVIMTNHVHLIIGTDGTNKLESIIRDLKRHTSKELRRTLEENPSESRKAWITWMLKREGNFNRNNNDWQLWQQHSHPIELSDPQRTKQRLDYLHNNPVRAGFVPEAHFWQWSSAFDYSGGKGLLELIFIE